jgi:hypothetical protein
MKKIILILTIILIYSQFGFAEEKILLYNSYVDIQPNGELIVVETIKVNVEGKQIKRGIYRDFPTIYKDKNGLTYQVTFNVLEVTKNEQKENYFIKPIPNGKRIYIGKKDVFLNPGIYEYKIKYSTAYQIGFFEKFDELYWNVTGNDWAFPIEKVSFYATIAGKPIEDVISYGAYTGKQGSKDKNFRVEKDEKGNLIFYTSNLKPKEGLTVYIDFPKGLIKEPSKKEKILQTANNNMTLLISIAGLIVLLILNTIFWFKVGKDPEKGVIVPLFEPPDNISAGAMRYLFKMGYDNKVTASAIISMASKGAMKINEKKKKITLIKDENVGELSSAEKVFYDNLFKRKTNIDLHDEDDAEIFREALKKYKNALKNEFEKNYFNTNKKYLLPGVLITIVSLITAVYFSHDKYNAIFMTAWLTMWSFGITLLIMTAVRIWSNMLRDKSAGSILQTIFITLILLPFLGGEIMGLYMLANSTSFIFIFILLLYVIFQILFYHWMKAPTRLGRKVMDQIEGFKEFLTRVEKDRLKLMYSKEELPKIFEKYLPYAMALDVEDKWANAIESALKELNSSYNYRNVYWYNGTITAGSLAGFSEGLSSAAVSATSAASSPPGSSSGGIGGSSGGGGGGGGGGGW